MTNTVYIDLTAEKAWADSAGTTLPAVVMKLRRVENLAFAFMTSGTVAAVTGWVTGTVVIKEYPSDSAFLLDTSLAVTGTTTSTRYTASWAAVDCDSTPLRTFLGDETLSKECFCEIEWTDATGTHSVTFAIRFAPTFLDPEDAAPDPMDSASWGWLKARLAAGEDVGFDTDETGRVITINVLGLSDHIADTANPHAVTKSQVGLANVTNDAQLKAADLDIDATFAADSDAKIPSQKAVKTALALKAPLASPALTGTPTAPTAAGGTNTTQIASTAFVRAEIAAVVDSSPGTLDTLNELAAALGDDANFAATTAAALALKAPLASPALTGNPTSPTQAAEDNSTKLATTAYVDVARAADITSVLARMKLANVVTLGWTSASAFATGSSTSAYNDQYGGVSTGATAGSDSMIQTPSYYAAVPFWAAVTTSPVASARWNKPMVMTFTFCMAESSTNGQVWLKFDQNTYNSGAFVTRGLGIRVDGTSVVGIWHNGTTGGATAELVNLSTNYEYHTFAIVSDGAGNVSWVVDGAVVASITNGPSTLETAGYTGLGRWSIGSRNNADSANVSALCSAIAIRWDY